MCRSRHAPHVASRARPPPAVVEWLQIVSAQVSGVCIVFLLVTYCGHRRPPSPQGSTCTYWHQCVRGGQGGQDFPLHPLQHVVSSPMSQFTPAYHDEYWRMCFPQSFAIGLLKYGCFGRRFVCSGYCPPACGFAVVNTDGGNGNIGKVQQKCFGQSPRWFETQKSKHQGRNRWRGVSCWQECIAVA
jgi:hypothetical protein